MKFLCYVFVLFLISSCSSTDDNINNQGQQQEEPSNDDPNIVNILFIGNSLTFFNSGVDFHVQQFYNNGIQGGNPVITDERTLSGYTLRQHLENPGTINKLEERDWEMVVLQENGNHAFENPEEALASFNEFKEFFEGKATRVFLFMTWAYEGVPEMTEALEKLYNQAAAETGFTVLPVGLGWRDVTNNNPDFELLSSDGVHPSPHGTYFSAAIIFEILSDQLAADNPYQGPIQQSHADYLKQAASETVKLYY